MACVICSDLASAIYLAADGDIIIDVCPRHLPDLPGLTPVFVDNEKCRTCGQVGKCCRTRKT